MAKWFVTIEGREQGPLSAAELKRAVAKGRVTAETPVRKEGVDSRVPAAQVKGLFAAAKDKTAKLTPPLKKDETETTSDDSEELKLAETNWSPPVATPSDDLQQPPAAKTKQKKQPAMQLHRGWWVTAVAIVNFLVGSYIIVMTVELLTPYIWAPYAGRDAEWGIIVNSFGTVFELFVNLARMAVIVIFGVPACFSLLAGYGLIKRHEWARILSLVLAVLSGLLCGLLVATHIESTDPRSLGDLRSLGYTLLFGFYAVFNFVILLNPRFAAEFE